MNVHQVLKVAFSPIKAFILANPYNVLDASLAITD